MSDYDTASESTMAMGGSYAGNALGQLVAHKRHRQPTVREQVVERIEAMKQQLAQHEATLAILDAEPGVEKALDALRRIGV